MQNGSGRAAPNMPFEKHRAGGDVSCPLTLKWPGQRLVSQFTLCARLAPGPLCAPKEIFTTPLHRRCPPGSLGSKQRGGGGAESGGTCVN